MSRLGHTYTRHFDLDTRQHEILGLDLGEGPSRRLLVTGAVLYVVWAGGMLLLFGAPSKVTFTLYAAPPGVITFYGAQRSKTNERRRNLAQWSLFLRYLMVGHRPVINGGRRAAARSEWLPMRARLGDRAEVLTGLPGLGALDTALGKDEPRATAGGAIAFDNKPRMYGPDVVYRARKRTGKKQS